jgi:hypothetical protein
MRRAVFACAAGGMLALAAWVGIASCGLDTAGLREAVNDASSGSRPDVTPTKDGRAGGGDATESGPQDDAAAGDVLAPDASADGQEEEDAPSLTDVAPDTPPTCTGCGPNQCCDDGACTQIGNTACGDPGQACVDCTTSPLGNQCIMLNAHQTCGCAGPGNQNQCPTGNACYNKQCGTSCDGQHPCNGGCCSGNDVASSTCVAACGAGMMCQGNYCQ